MPPCAVAVCNNSPKNFPNGSFHRFPRDSKLRQAWIKICRRKTHFNPDVSRICSEHFVPDDYERNLRFELTGARNVRKLKPNAVPSLNYLPTNPRGGRDFVFSVAESSELKLNFEGNENEDTNQVEESELVSSPEEDVHSDSDENPPPTDCQSIVQEPDYKATCLKNDMEKRILEARCIALSKELDRKNERLKAKEKSEKLLLAAFEEVIAENEKLRNKLKYV